MTKFSFPTKNNKQNPKNSNYLSFFTVLKKKNVDKTTGITGGTGISSEIELEKKNLSYGKIPERTGTRKNLQSLHLLHKHLLTAKLSKEKKIMSYF